MHSNIGMSGIHRQSPSGSRLREHRGVGAVVVSRLEVHLAGVVPNGDQFMLVEKTQAQNVQRACAVT